MSKRIDALRKTPNKFKRLDAETIDNPPKTNDGGYCRVAATGFERVALVTDVLSYSQKTKMKHDITGFALLVGLLLLLDASPVSAQHHGEHGGGYLSTHHGGYVPAHHGVNYGHSDWHHVIPHHPTYVGAYYTTGQTHYYTPSPISNHAPVGGSAPVAIAVQRPVELAFGGYSRYEDLAGRLSIEANALCLDLHYNYRHNRNFAEVYRESYDVLQAAKYVHGKEHQGDRDAITRRMVEIDKLFHHVQDETRGWTRAGTRQISSGELPAKTAAVEAVLHHLCYDVGVRPHEVTPEEAPPPDVSNEEAPPPLPSKLSLRASGK